MYIVHVNTRLCSYARVGCFCSNIDSCCVDSQCYMIQMRAYIRMMLKYMYAISLVILYFRLIGRSWSDIHVVASREYIQHGENLFLVCLTRVANTRFTWFKEGKLLTVPVAGLGVFQKRNTSDSDLGNYTCRATTDNASAVASASIIVRRFGKL